ncbi:MAG TPA: hypothetical protein ENJ30_07565 [Desulfobulbaceae bacterium]|nr:hypothetical protein [Desulfobulbaceae bacterium]
MDAIERKEVVSRVLFYRSGFKNCYVAKTIENEIAYIQWLIYPSENSIIKKHFQKRFYLLEEFQVMIENAFTFPKFRGLGIMPVVTKELMKRARERGYKSAISYIRKDNIISLNEFMRLNFKITELLKEYKFLGVVKRNL